MYKTPRERVIDRLEEVGIIARWEEVWCQEGAHRRMDLARWGITRVTLRTPLIDAGRHFRLHSWDTMTNCARFGVEWNIIDLLEIEICARRPTEKVIRQQVAKVRGTDFVKQW